jgi:hypothetical protein
MVKMEKEQAEFLGEKDPFVNFSYTPSENEVVTKNAHLYPDLLKLALRKALRFCGIETPEEEQVKKVWTNANHEFGHYTAAVGECEIEMSYGVRFKKDSSKQQVSWQPFVGLNGRLRSSEYEKLVRGPESLSKGDEEMLK